MYADVNKRREYNRQYAQETRHFYKSRHRCVDCGEQDAYTLNGRSRCYDCNEKAKAYRNTEKERCGAIVRRWKRIEVRKSQGLCTACAAKLPDGYYPYHTCESCRAKSRERISAYRCDKVEMPREYREVWHLCRRCGAPLHGDVLKVDGEQSRLCQRCYDHATEALKKARAAYEQRYGHPYGKQKRKDVNGN